MEGSNLQHNKQIRGILNKHFFKIFGEIDEETKSYIESKLEWVDMKRDEFLFHQDEEADGLYTVLLGKLEALIETPDDLRHLGFVNPSETVGEMALITGDKRSASIRCYRNATLVKMSNDVFKELCLQHPSFALNISKIIISRLKNSQNRRNESLTFNNVAFYRADLNQTTSNALSLLFRLYMKQKESYVFNVISLKKHLGLGPEVEITLEYKNQINTWLNELEFKYNRIILDLREFSNEVMRFLLDYCDLCVVFKTFGKDPVPPFREESFYSSMKNATQKMRLVLCHHKSTQQASNTRLWLEHRPKMDHIHIQHGNPRDIARLYRYLTGTSVALVLGGGGAKGMSHIGVLRALNEANVPIDYICGTSIGATIAGLYAFYNDTDMTIRAATEIFLKNPTPKSDLNIIPKKSFYKGKRIKELLEMHCNDIEIEDLWLPFFAVASNISNPKINVLSKGPLRSAISASTAVPGLFPPVIIDNEVHVDGGIFSNLPVDIMMKENIGTLIACRVNKVNAEPESNEVSIPGIFTTFMKSLMAYSDSNSDYLQQFVDIYFEPDTSSYALLDWKHTEKLIELGYDHAKKILEEIDVTTIIK